MGRGAEPIVGVRTRWGRGEAALEVDGVSARGVLATAARARVCTLVATALAARVAGAIHLRAWRVEDHHVGLGPNVLPEPHSLVAALRPPLLGQDGPHGCRAAPIRGYRRGLRDTVRGRGAVGRRLLGLSIWGCGLWGCWRGRAGWGTRGGLPVGLIFGEESLVVKALGLGLQSFAGAALESVAIVLVDKDREGDQSQKEQRAQHPA